MATQTLTTGQIISLGDGRLACTFPEVHQALDALLDDHLNTHQITRASRYAEPFIRDACPWVTDLPPLDVTRIDDKHAAVLAWVDQISAKHGDQHEVPDLAGQWVHFDAIDEAVAQFGADRVVIVGQDPIRGLGRAASEAGEAFKRLAEHLPPEDES